MQIDGLVCEGWSTVEGVGELCSSRAKSPMG